MSDVCQTLTLRKTVVYWINCSQMMSYLLIKVSLCKTRLSSIVPISNFLHLQKAKSNYLVSSLKIEHSRQIFHVRIHIERVIGLVRVDTVYRSL